MRFEWDPKKNATNRRKHGIAFEDVIAVFGVPYLERPEEDPHEGESRWIAVGEVEGRVLVVVYTWRGNARRIISGRKATKTEREQFYGTIYSG